MALRAQLLQALLRSSGGGTGAALGAQEPQQDDSQERMRALQLQALLTTLQVSATLLLPVLWQAQPRCSELRVGVR